MKFMLILLLKVHILLLCMLRSPLLMNGIMGGEDSIDHLTQ